MTYYARQILHQRRQRRGGGNDGTDMPNPTNRETIPTSIGWPPSHLPQPGYSGRYSGPPSPPSPPAPNESSESTVDDASPPLLSSPDNKGFQVVTAGRRPATPTLPPNFGTRFNALADTDEPPNATPAVNSNLALRKALRAAQLDLYSLFRYQESEVQNLVAAMIAVL